jgi:hypothetical protein
MRKERRLDQAQGVLRSIYPENGTDSLQGQLAQIQRVGREVMQYAHPEQVQEVQWVLDQAETMAAYEAMRDETEAAAQALEAYRAEFGTAMQDDVRGLADRAHRLFSEERFARRRSPRF